MNPRPGGYTERLGEALIAQGALSADQLRIALLEQEKCGVRLGRLLVELGFVSEAALKTTLAENQGKASIELAQTVADTGALALVPRALAERHHVLPLFWEAGQRTLTLAAADAHDLAGQDKVRAALAAALPEYGQDIRIETLLAGEAEISEAIDRCYGHTLAIDDLVQEIERGMGTLSETDSGAAGTEAVRPVARLIDALLADAVKNEASDLHFEPERHFLRIRYRQDGILRQIRALHRDCWPALAVRLKVMSGMNIAETRAPQDGHITRAISGRPVDFRVASQPTLHGENIVLRVLDRQKGIVPLEKLGLSATHLALLERMLLRPEGLLLVTGPTGSGKTTTLYSLLNRINSEQVNIMTLEDPVEYPMPLVRQTSVNERVKLDFASGIRSLMRQDPDVLLVGEIRDAETADMAFRAAMTGHQVFATLHTASALGAIPRLRDIGVKPDILSGNLTGVIAQRLARRLCPHCRVASEPNARARRLLGLADGESATIFHAAGCADCRFTGYRGRLAMMELLVVDRELEDLIAESAPRRALLGHARRQGFRALAEDGAARVLAGDTTLEELVRVVDLSDRLAAEG
ncbi:MAG: Flp pilus assembly complex ATPase component TadA [Zoogloeaceae bacterium]|jgi:general secretion pathway protein E/type IV pilus assembly protein PilB|nr:Flp pilus assembly complex ATPase component TadA [Zoogloeaceae bacterium]